MVGEGWHGEFGGPHAEVHALSQAGERSRGATAYVSLEPCNHDGKTPPCTTALLEAEISRLKNVELREKNEQLQDLLRELKEAETQLVQQEKMAALGKLVAGLVHEVNTPLGAINSVSDTVARGIVNIIDVVETAGSVEEIRENRKFARALDILHQNSRVAIDAVNRIGRIVNSLKNFIRLDEADFQEADIHEGLDSTITLLEHEFSGRIEAVRAYGELPLVQCYASELNQVFMNLLANAAQAIEGNGTITVRTSHQGGYVRVVPQRQDRAALVAVVGVGGVEDA